MDDSLQELQKNRLNHLSFYIRRSLTNLSYDAIARQMERHRISSNYSTERLTELFSGFLVNEREEYTAQIERDIKIAKNNKQSIWEVLKREISKNDAKMETTINKNIQLRRQLNSLQAIVDTNNWKNEKIQETTLKKISQIQKEVLVYAPAINEVHEQASDVLNDLKSLRIDIKSMQRNFDVSIQNMYSAICEKIENLQIKSDGIKFENLRNHEIKTNCDNEQMKSSLISVLSHINKMYKKGQVPLSLKNIDKDFSKVLKKISKPYPTDSDLRKASLVRTKIEDACNTFEIEWHSKIQQQQQRMKKLRAEFLKAEKRLEELMEVDSCIDLKLLAELEREHISYTKNTQVKTDQLVELALGQSSSPNSEIDIVLPLSPIPNKKW